MDSILDSVKKLLGLTEDYTAFDTDIIVSINSVFATLAQIGFGPAKGYSIENSDNTWDEVIPAGQNLEFVKTYITLKVQMLFDPPQNSKVLQAKERQIAELEWRINVECDNRIEWSNS